MQSISAYLAFFAGLLSFFSPCVFPLIPTYILYLAGVTTKEYSQTQDKTRIKKAAIINALSYVLGFSLVFILLGAAASAFGQLVIKYQEIIRVIGGIIIIIFGFYIMGIFKLSFLDIERRLENKSKEVGYFSSFIVGMTMAAGWIPCTGPILGSILLMASSSDTLLSGIMLLVFYSLGLAIPFLITAVLIDLVLGAFKKIQQYLGLFNLVSGIFIVVMGILVLLKII